MKTRKRGVASEGLNWDNCKMSPQIPESPSLHMDDIVGRLRHNETYYREKDPANRTLSAFAEAALAAIDTMPFFRQNIEDLVALRHDLNPSHAIKLLERSYQAVLMQHDGQYPHAYQATETWHDAFEEIEAEDSHSEMVYYRLLTQSVQSNIAERYKTVKLLASIYRDRFGDAPSHLDVGSSVLHGDIKLVYNRNGNSPRVPFGSIRVNEALDDQALRAVERGERGPRQHRLASELANIVLRQEVGFGEVMGVDLTNVDDPAIKDWAKSCSFYPDELRDAQKVAEYDELDRLDPDHRRVRFAKIDFSNTGDIKALRDMIGEQTFDIITFSTIFYQVDIRERHAMLINASQLLSDKGIILIQDAPDGNFETRYRYGASIIDSTRPELGVQQVLRWKTPRCQEAMIGLGKLSLRGKLLTFDEALHAAVEST